MLLKVGHGPHRDPFLHPFNDHSHDPDADSEYACVDPKQTVGRKHIYGAPHLDNCLDGKPISNEYFDNFDDEIDPRSQFSWEEEYGLVHWCVKHNLSRTAIDKHLRNPMIATVSNFTSSHTLFKRLNKMSYAMAINFSKSGKVCFNRLANTNIIPDDYNTPSFYRNPVGCIDFVT